MLCFVEHILLKHLQIVNFIGKFKREHLQYQDMSQEEQGH